MKKLQYKARLIIFLFVLLCISCTKKSKIESIFIANKNEYWEYEDYCWGTNAIYFQFKENGTQDKYLLYIDDGFSLFNTDMGVEVKEEIGQLKMILLLFLIIQNIR